MPTKFKNPYADTANKVRLQTYVDRTDHDLIHNIHPDRGTYETTVNVLFAKFCAALRKAKINQLADHARFERFVSEFEITTPKKKGKNE